MTSTACPDCYRGAVDTETPTGTETTIHGLPTYVARPEGTPKGLIVIIPDGLGWKFPNDRTLADRYAKKGGYLVYIPEFMNGHAPPMHIMGTVESFMTETDSLYRKYVVKPLQVVYALYYFLPWMILCRQSVVKPVVFDYFKALRTDPETSDLKIAAAGFCWGGQFVFLLAQDSPSSRVHRAGSEAGQLQPLIDAGFTAHPSNLTMPQDAQNAVVPTSVAVGDVDMAWKLESIKEAKDIMEKKRAGDHEVVIIPGAKHGFAVRPLPSDPSQKELQAQAEEQALNWFKKWIG